MTEKILVLTVDGRTLVGTLLSTDQLTNLVLLDTIERIIRTPDDPEPSSQIEHGLYLIRGDNVVVCGEVDEKIDADIDCLGLGLSWIQSITLCTSHGAELNGWGWLRSDPTSTAIIRRNV